MRKDRLSLKDRKRLEKLREVLQQREAYLRTLDPMDPKRRLSAYDFIRVVRR